MHELEKYRNKIILADVREGLKSLPDGCVQTCVTSPPYWGLRDYGLEPSIWGGEAGCRHEWGEKIPQNSRHLYTEDNSGKESPVAGKGAYPSSRGQYCRCGAWSGCYGLEPTPELYVQHTVEIFREVRRVLRPDGCLWLNLGDSYAGGGRAGKNPELLKNHLMFGKPKSEYNASIMTLPSPIPEGLKPKDLVGIPWRVAFALQADGWWLRSDIIWAKPNPMPESVTDRPTKAHEYIFLLTKSGTPQYWTHRDGAGSRTRPKPDIRWVNQVTGEEIRTKPADVEKIVTCPECKGTGKVLKDVSYDFCGKWIEDTTEEACDKCAGKKKIKLWERINLWQGQDYFYDNEAVKEPCESGPSDIKKMIEQKERIGGKNKHLIDPFNKASAATNIGNKRGVGDPSGRNRRSVWTVATQPYPESHFAVFPPKLIEPCILAGSSPKACEVCGAPWARAVEREPMEIKRSGRSEQMGKYGRTATSGTMTKPPMSITTGWQPTCSCEKNTGSERCIVLDPFMGAGTTGLVAAQWGRDYSGIELNPGYLQMAEKRIKEATSQQRMFTEVT